MPATEEHAVIDVTSPDSSISNTPFLPSPSSSPSEHSFSPDSEFALAGPASTVNYIKIEIPLEQTLRDLLQKATGADDLTTVTKVKLQVIATDICLQHLNVHTPHLTELNLEGSVVSSLRDLGCALKQLKILRVPRCGLTSLDGMFGLQSLEELYAGRNTIEDLSPCSCLPYIKLIDLKRNCIRDISTVSFLSLCATLEHLELDENEDLIEIPEYRQIIKALLPNLKTLDGKDLADEKDFREVIRAAKAVEDGVGPCKSQELNVDIPQSVPHKISKRPLLTEGTFTVRFPPKVLSPRPSSGSSTDSTIITSSYRNDLPSIIHQQESDGELDKTTNS